MNNIVVVTKHIAMVQYLKEIGFINDDTPIFNHVEVEDITGKDVVGVLPMRLAVHANSVTEISVDLPKNLRGKELSLDEFKSVVKQPFQTYMVNGGETDMDYLKAEITD